MPPIPSQLQKITTCIKEAAKEAGNVLFMILIAVALFAALAYAVTQSTRSGGGNSSREEASLGASSTSQYMASVEMAVQRMMISNGCPIEQISFANAIVGGWDNSNAPADKHCHVFDPAGGGVVPQRMPLKYTDPSATNWLGGGFHFMIVSVQNVGTSLPDVLMLYGGVKLDVCSEVNIKMGLKQRDDSLITDSHDDFANFTTNAQPLSPFPSPTGILGDTDARIVGARTFCIEQAGLWGNYFYHVLIPR